MHAGLLDVFHNSADHHVGAVGQRIDIDFRRFFQKLIDQHGTRRAHHRRLRHVFLHGVHVVRDDHRAPAKHVARPHQDRHADLTSNTRCFFRN